MALVHTVETLEYPCLMLGRNADAVVGDFQYAARVGLFEGKLHLAALVVVCNGVVAEVADHFVKNRLNPKHFHLVKVAFKGNFTALSLFT